MGFLREKYDDPCVIYKGLSLRLMRLGLEMSSFVSSAPAPELRVHTHVRTQIRSSFFLRQSTLLTERSHGCILLKSNKI